ncbi:hypothetical protein PIB30_057205 [Stylosanthes scabra]|uniref:Transposase n=1 Tax=Stylosanthes scabra TaxID=79078 RepID=A0ABU6WI37_9FABA|nr:hypothetical protein [Stylosanthes scabra]
MEGSAEFSSVLPHDVLKNTHSTGSDPRQDPRKVRQFRPPRNEAKPAHSNRVAIPQVPAARDYFRPCTDMDDSDSGDPDYNPVPDEVDSWEDHIDTLFEREEAVNRDTEIIGKFTSLNGVKTPQNITARQVFSVPAGRRVVLPLNSSLQAIGEAGGMLSTVLGVMVIDFAAFPIHVRSWKHMPEYKKKEYDRQIKRYFHFEVEDEDAVKKIILAKLGKIWKDIRGRLFHKFYDETKSLDENVLHRCPRGINPDHWRAFLEYR